MQEIDSLGPAVVTGIFYRKSNAPPWVFFTFVKLYEWYQIAQSTTSEERFLLFCLKELHCDIVFRKILIKQLTSVTIHTSIKLIPIVLF